ncbi:adenylate kinase [Aerosakkonemataceae cyanobacterium BLCC-F50]|uniref:Adenylate kinase n=1 Tax=Floridaenema flaviceps BLCC-F50 TaxID=3153642 RepID=A0ABV4Y4L2_9CYAN
MTRLIFLGAPGAGKGTQAQKVAQLCNIPHISTGDILRNEVAQGTDLGIQAKSYQEKGELVPDQLILDMVSHRLSESDAQSGWILDGFPRNVAQAKFLDELLTKLQQKCDRVINLEVPDQIIVDRLLKRGRKDDSEEVIRRRLEVYREQTAPLIDYYSQRQLLVSVQGNQSMEEVTASLKKAVDLSC